MFKLVPAIFNGHAVVALQLLVVLFLTAINFAAHGIEKITINIKDHLFYPAEIVIPAMQKVRIVFVNQDDTPEEIDSFDLNREKVVFAHSSAQIFVGPLKPGQYRFFGEYHPNTAVGYVTVFDPSEVPNVD